MATARLARPDDESVRSKGSLRSTTDMLRLGRACASRLAGVEDGPTAGPQAAASIPTRARTTVVRMEATSDSSRPGSEATARSIVVALDPVNWDPRRCRALFD